MGTARKGPRDTRPKPMGAPGTKECHHRPAPDMPTAEALSQAASYPRPIQLPLDQPTGQHMALGHWTLATGRRGTESALFCRTQSGPHMSSGARKMWLLGPDCHWGTPETSITQSTRQSLLYMGYPESRWILPAGLGIPLALEGGS